MLMSLTTMKVFHTLKVFKYFSSDVFLFMLQAVSAVTSPAKTSQKKADRNGGRKHRQRDQSRDDEDETTSDGLWRIHEKVAREISLTTSEGVWRNHKWVIREISLTTLAGARRNHK